MTRTRGQAQMPAQPAEASKSKKLIPAKKSLKVTVEKLDSSLYTSYDGTIMDDEPSKNIEETTKGSKQPAAGPAKRTLRGKENKAEEMAIAEKPKPTNKKAKQEMVEPVIVKRVTRRAGKALSELEAANDQYPSDAIVSKREKPKAKESIQKNEVKVVVKQDKKIPAVKEIRIRVEKCAVSVRDDSPKVKEASKTEKPRKTQQSTENETEKAQKPASEGNQRKTRAASKVKEPAKVPETRIPVRKASKISVEPSQSSTERLETRIDSAVKADDKLNGNLSPVIKINRLKRALEKPEAPAPEKEKQDEKTAAKKKPKVSSKVEEAPKRATRGNGQLKLEKQQLPANTRKKASNKLEKIKETQIVVEKVPLEKLIETESSKIDTKIAKQKVRADELQIASSIFSPPAKPVEKSSPAFKAPLPISPSLKVIESIDEFEEDPYSFISSQNEVPQNQKKKKATKKRPQAKPGNTMGLMMRQEALGVVISSINAKSNPSKYQDEFVEVEKQIKDSEPSIPKIAVVDYPEKPEPATSKSFAVRKVTKPITQSTSAPLPRSSFAGFSAPKLNATTSNVFKPLPIGHSKVWHSPPRKTPKEADPTVATPAFISNSPPIQSAFIMQMVAMQMNATATTPSRVLGNLPSAFYMELSKNNGTPTFSSDLVEKTRENEKKDEVSPKNSKKSSRKSWDDQENEENQQENEENQQENEENQQQNAGKDKSSSRERSALGDSNAENMEPSGFIKSPVNKRNRDPKLRSPLKSLAIPKLPESDVTSISVFNTTMDQSIAVKSFKVVDEPLDNDAICEEAEKLRDEFGFDELVEADRRDQSTSSGVVDTSSEFRDKLKTMKRYLPSRNNKNRDRNIFPTTPIKQSDVFKGPKESSHVTIRKFMTASTPLVNTQKSSVSSFGNVSNIEEAKKTETELMEAEKSSIEVEDESEIELFADQSELYSKAAQRSYTRRKRIPDFLRNVEHPESDSDGEVKAPTKAKKRKPDIEKTAEFKKFVHDKSNEFAEVDNYEMVIDGQ